MNTQKWFRIAIFNIIVVALYGSLMRYKIAFDFPFFNQKNLLHAHSHFAFGGWVSHLIYTGLTWLAAKHLSAEKIKKYHRLILANLICSFGMLISFTIEGYKFTSITFSTLTLIVSFIYGWVYIKDLKSFPANNPSAPWIKTGLLLNILSAAGPLALAYTMAIKHVDSYFYLGSVYYYLHFQYSGWFFFGSMALVVAALPKEFPSLHNQFKVLAATAIPTFFLSILWVKLPMWLYILTVIATVIQFVTWIIILKKLLTLKNYKTEQTYPNWVNIFFIAALFSITVKFLLQTISVIPSLSNLVFGLRPIVIAYLHLVLLGVYSLFYIGYLFANKWISITPLARFSAFLFLVGVVLNELFLGVQGIVAFAYIPIPHINELLFFAAIILFSSALILFLSQWKKPLMSS